MCTRVDSNYYISIDVFNGIRISFKSSDQRLPFGVENHIFPLPE